MHKADETFSDVFYKRQITLKELGQSGQQKLCNSKIALVGVGGLGTVASLYLALSGVGHLRLIDQDIVELQNLHRQILYTPQDVNHPKAEIAAKKLQNFNPLIKTEPVPENINSNNVEDLLAGVDLVVDGLDNISTRYIINRACSKMQIPYVFGAAIGLEGNLSVFNPPKTPCLECILPNISDSSLLKCSTRGVIGVTPGLIGIILATEAIKIIANLGTPLTNKLMICDLNDMFFTTIDIAKRDDCPVCKGSKLPESKNKLVWLCGQNMVNINPEKPLKLNLDNLSQIIKNLGYHIHIKSSLSLMFNYKNIQVSLFKDGRMLMRNVKNENTALRYHRELINQLNLH